MWNKLLSADIINLSCSKLKCWGPLWEPRGVLVGVPGALADTGLLSSLKTHQQLADTDKQPLGCWQPDREPRRRLPAAGYRSDDRLLS